jgi:small redox-active disulfide protein 2
VCVFLKGVGMKNIQIVGMGCPKCGKLFELTDVTAKELGFPYKIEKVYDVDKIVAMGVMVTPALIVDGVVKAAGKVPSKEALKEFLS